MRSKLMLRKRRPLYVGAAVATLAIPASAVALAAGQADAQGAIQITLTPNRSTFGRTLTVTGNATAAEAGQQLALQFAPAGGTAWQTLGRTRAGADGRFRVTAMARQSGSLRVVPAGTGAATDASTASGGVAPSAPLSVSVAARFSVPGGTTTVLGGSARLHGRLLPALPGRQVRLLIRGARGWRAVSATRTNSRGAFSVSVPRPSVGRHRLEVSFAGDAENAAALAPAGSVVAMRQSLASWYDDGGSTACGSHSHYGVANKTLPCGTKVTFAYGGRTVTAVVDDRGPYVDGRDWDLNQNTAAALGFDGVGTVWSSI